MIVCSGLLAGVNRNRLTPTVSLERHHTISSGEQSVVSSARDVTARVEARPTLANDDAASADPLPTESFYAEPLRIAVAAVPARAYALLMRHEIVP